MAKLKTQISKFLLSAQTMIENALADEEIKQTLTAYGYTAEILTVGKKLYEKVAVLQNTRKREYGEQIAATAELNESRKKAKQLYMKTLKIARVALKEKVKADKAVMLYGARKRSFSGWFEQAQAFYANLICDDEFMATLSAYGYSPEKLEQEFAFINKVFAKHLIQKKETGEAREATIIRDNALDDLIAWISDFKAVAKVAFAENPQQLEKLGIVIKREV